MATTRVYLSKGPHRQRRRVDPRPRLREHRRVPGAALRGVQDADAAGGDAPYGADVAGEAGEAQEVEDGNDAQLAARDDGEERPAAAAWNMHWP